MCSITSEEDIQQVRERGGADFAFAFGEAARFRVSVPQGKGQFRHGHAADSQQNAHLSKLACRNPPRNCCSSRAV